MTTQYLKGLLKFGRNIASIVTVSLIFSQIAHASFVYDNYREKRYDYRNDPYNAEQSSPYYTSDNDSRYTNYGYQNNKNRYYKSYKKAKKYKTYDMRSHQQGPNSSFVFDPSSLRWFAYNNSGQLLNSGRASGGRHYCPDVKRACRTPVGIFRVYHKGSADCKSSKFPLGRGGAPMGYCMFFHKGYAIHSSNDVPDHNASHGCIRVEHGAAQWLSKSFMRHGTRVIVKPYYKRQEYRRASLTANENTPYLVSRAV